VTASFIIGSQWRGAESAVAATAAVAPVTPAAAPRTISILVARMVSSIRWTTGSLSDQNPRDGYAGRVKQLCSFSQWPRAAYGTGWRWPAKVPSQRDGTGGLPRGRKGHLASS
jgi:hypothetical protein